MRFSRFILLFLIFPASIYAQNLVLNPSLEERDTFRTVLYPRDSLCRNHVLGWFNPYYASTDFFNSDGKHLRTGSPLFANKIKAHSGNCYGGIYIDNTKWKEYIAFNLIQPLEKGKNYKLEMFLNISKKSRLACRTLQIEFADTSRFLISAFQGKYTLLQMPGTAQTAMIGNWVSVSVVFTAQGGEKAMALGYLDDLFQSVSLPETPFNKVADSYCYYYIDDVSLTETTGPPIFRARPSRPTIYFDVDKAIVKKEYFLPLDSVVMRMKGDALLKVTINGFTDSTGTNDDNLELSTERAQAVADYIVSKGIDPKRITIRGYSEANPVSEDRARNRRVEFVFTRN